MIHGRANIIIVVAIGGSIIDESGIQIKIAEIDLLVGKHFLRLIGEAKWREHIQESKVSGIQSLIGIYTLETCADLVIAIFIKGLVIGKGNTKCIVGQH